MPRRYSYATRRRYGAPSRGSYRRFGGGYKRRYRPQSGKRLPAAQRGPPANQAPAAMHFLDYVKNTFAVDNFLASGTAIQPINIVKQGNSFTQRSGNKIAMHSIQLKLEVEPAQAMNQCHWRWALIYDRQPNGVEPNLSDIFSNFDLNGAPLLTGALTYLMTNPNNRDRFLVLRDRAIHVPYTALTIVAGVPTVAQQLQQCMVDTSHIEDYVKLKGLVTLYKSDPVNADDIASISVGAIYMIVYAENPAASAGNFLNCRYTTRLRFYEI